MIRFWFLKLFFFKAYIPLSPYICDPGHLGHISHLFFRGGGGPLVSFQLFMDIYKYISKRSAAHVFNIGFFKLFAFGYGKKLKVTQLDHNIWTLRFPPVSLSTYWKDTAHLGRFFLQLNYVYCYSFDDALTLTLTLPCANSSWWVQIVPEQFINCSYIYHFGPKP